MTEGIWVAIIGVIGGIITVIVQQRRQRKHTTAQAKTLEIVRDQVQNSHGTNLRNDIDVVLSELRGLRKDVGRLDDRDLERGRDMRDLRQAVTEIDKKLDDHLDYSRTLVEQGDARLGHLENTLNPKDQ